MAVEINTVQDAITLGLQLIVGFGAAGFGIPKLLNMRKGDKVAGAGLDANLSIMESLDERVQKNEEAIDRMDALIRKQQIKLTKLQVLVIQLEGLIVVSGIVIPEPIRESIRTLTAEDA